jgi:hypothetical protein
MGKGCGYPKWSACDYGCMQTKIESVLYSDGFCHEVSRQKRPCHIGACARSDPCRVPFIVHIILAFHGGSLVMWTHISEEMLALALANVVGMQSKDELFTAGDVHVVAALPWHQDTDSESVDVRNVSEHLYSEDFNSVRLGIKVVVEVSIFNPSSAGTNSTTTQLDDSEGDGDSPITVMIQNITDRLRGRKRSAVCASSDLYRLAQSALRAKDVLRHDRFMSSLMEELKSSGEQNAKAAFGQIDGLSPVASKSSVVSVWLIRTGIEDEINYFGPQKPISVRVLVFVQNMVFLSFIFFAVMVVWGCCLSLYEYATGRQHQNKRRNRYIVSFLRGQQPYALVTRDEECINPNDVEDSLLRGTRSAVQLTHRMPAYKLTVPKKRPTRYGVNGAGHSMSVNR